MKRIIGVVTTGRADYGICLPVLRAIDAAPELKLRLIVTGMHLAPEFGLSVQEIERDGFKIHDRVEILLSSDTPEGTAKSMGLAVLGFSQVFARSKPDILLVVGDRFEVHAAVSATIPFKIPVAHVHGGEITEGAIDEVFRHSITKMSHLHFATTQLYGGRIAQMGEEDWRIYVTGAPGLDNMLSLPVPSREEIEQRFQIDLSDLILLSTYHPVTRAKGTARNEIGPLLSAIQDLDIQVIFTFPNADAGGRAIMSEIEAFEATYGGKAKLVVNASQSFYIGLMRYVTAMVGNSSSGIIEAPSFELPVVNIGPRQAGRIRAPNVIDVENDGQEILEGLKRAVSKDFRQQLKGLQNPYGDGNASERIVKVLKQVDLQALVHKRFSDSPVLS